MSYEEKSSWVMGVLSVTALVVYVVVTLAQSGAVPLVDTPYAVTMIAVIVGSIVVSIAIHIGLGLFSRDRKADQRDRDFHNFGERMGSGFLVAGALGALIMAWLEVDWFWIANALFLGFVLSGILASIAKLVAYRRGIARAW